MIKKVKCEWGRYMITTIEAIKFRVFESKSFKIGERITAISGRNATGKSTLLAMIGNSCKLNYSKMKPLNTKNFTAEFSEILKGSLAFDKTGLGTVYTVNFDEYNETQRDYRDFRISWADNKTRFRVIPDYTYIDKNGVEKKSAAKKDYPCIYLGLSRLYPVGESEDDIEHQKIDLGPDKEWYIDNYKKILLIKDDILSINRVLISDTNTKKGVGIDTEHYDYITNSAGQDNIGQILLAILSFKRLKDSAGPTYNGGILLIDEVEATLHNHAQAKLMEFFNKMSKELNLQIVFTTHSELILKKYTALVAYNNEVGLNTYEIIYLNNANGVLDVISNPDYEQIVYDLNVTDSTKLKNKIVIYSEDQETRWFAEKLLTKYKMHLQFIKIEMGCSNLLQLDSKDPTYFSRILFIFDGDVTENDFKHFHTPNKCNKLILPGGMPPEEVIYTYLTNLKPDHTLWENLSKHGISKDSLKENGPNSNHYNGKQRDKNKKWFRDYKEIFDNENIIESWMSDNNDKSEKFIKQFVTCYNFIASLTFKPKLKI